MRNVAFLASRFSRWQKCDICQSGARRRVGWAVVVFREGGLCEIHYYLGGKRHCAHANRPNPYRHSAPTIYTPCPFHNRNSFTPVHPDIHPYPYIPAPQEAPKPPRPYPPPDPTRQPGLPGPYRRSEGIPRAYPKPAPDVKRSGRLKNPVGWVSGTDRAGPPGPIPGWVPLR